MTTLLALPMTRAELFMFILRILATPAARQFFKIPSSACSTTSVVLPKFSAKAAYTPVSRTSALAQGVHHGHWRPTR
ncbi:hypothetical protein D3C72_2420680 [compost metagenome]